MAGPQIGSLPPQGWYVDPGARAPFRYWDGSDWTAWVQRGGTSVRDPLGAPASPPPKAAPAVAPRKAAPAPVTPTAQHSYRMAVGFAIVGAGAVLTGILLFSTSRPSTAAWDIPPGEGYGILAAVAGVGLLGVAVVLWLLEYFAHPASTSPNTRQGHH